MIVYLQKTKERKHRQMHYTPQGDKLLENKRTRLYKLNMKASKLTNENSTWDPFQSSENIDVRQSGSYPGFGY